MTDLERAALVVFKRNGAMDPRPKEFASIRREHPRLYERWLESLGGCCVSLDWALAQLRALIAASEVKP